MNTFYKHFIALSVFIFTSIVVVTYTSAQTNRFNVDSIRALVKQLSSDTAQVKAYIDMASIIYCEDSNSKIEIANEAKKLAESIKWREGMYKANRKLGEIYFNCLRNYPRAFKSFQENVELARKSKDTLNEALALETIAKRHQRISEYNKALEYYNMVLLLKPNIDIQIGVIGDMGVVYSIITDYSHALSSYKYSLKMLDSLGETKKNGKDIQDTLQRAGLLLNIGDIYLAMSQQDKAYEQYEKVWKLSIDIKDLYFQIAGLSGMGRTFKLNNDFQKAIDNYELALHKCREINEFREEVKTLNELANTYLDMRNYAKALLYADTALRLAEDQSYADLLPKGYVTLGSIYIKQNRYDLAIPSLQRALGIAQRNTDLDDEKSAWYALYSAYGGNSQYKEAMDAQTNYYTIRDSIYSIEKQNETIKKDLEYEFREKQKIDSLFQKGIFDKTIDRQKRFTYTGFAGLLLVIALTFFIFRNYNIQRKYNELLSREKKSHLAHIEAQSNVLSDIAHTQAHHVRGPVATILGLVQLFNYEDPTDPVNKEVIEGLGVVTEKLDQVVKDVIIKENKLRYGKGDE